MIKKAANYIMSFLLLFSVIGISINKHYSGNELYSVSIFSIPESCCDEPCNYCNETTEVFRITDDFLQSVFHFVYDVKIINLTTRFHDKELSKYKTRYSNILAKNTYLSF